MSTLEERVERLETFMGNIDKVKSVYANTIEEICNRWLNILYIEPENPTEITNVLFIDGFLTELTTLSDLPHNTMFYVRPSHDFKYPDGSNTCTLLLKRDEQEISVPLKKCVIEEVNGVRSHHLEWLEDGDYRAGLIYSFYINSQNIAVISASDIGSEAYTLAVELEEELAALASQLEELSNSFSTSNLNAVAAEIGTLTITNGLNFNNSNPAALPTGSTITGTPVTPTDIVNKQYVDSKIEAKISEWYDAHTIFGTEPPETKLGPETVPEKAIYYKYSNS